MATATESSATSAQHTFENVRKAAEAAMKMQQEMFAQWTQMWPGLAQPKGDFAGRSQQFQKDWTDTVTDLMRKQRAVWDEQCRAGIESLEDAFQVASSKDPAELRERLASLFSKTMDVIKATSETQMHHFQEAMQKWIELSQPKS